MAVDPLVPWYLALGVGDSSVKIFDRRRLSVGQKADPSGLEGILLEHWSLRCCYICMVIN